MKTFLDSQLVLTKQDRLCRAFYQTSLVSVGPVDPRLTFDRPDIVHATSDPFHLHWLRQLNVMQHCNILTVGDCSKAEAQRYFTDFLLPHVPDKLKSRLSFEEVYKVFGGKLAHLSDFVGEFVNSDGDISRKSQGKSSQLDPRAHTGRKQLVNRHISSKLTRFSISTSCMRNLRNLAMRTRLDKGLRSTPRFVRHRLTRRRLRSAKPTRPSSAPPTSSRSCSTCSPAARTRYGTFHSVANSALVQSMV